MSELFDLTGKKAIITGSSKGIGKSIAKAMALHGAEVVISSRKADVCQETADEINEACKDGPGKAIVIPCNISDKAALEMLVEETRIQLGQIDILVCNAGIAGPSLKTWEYPSEEWQQVIDIDLTGVFNCLHVVSPIMIEQKYGRIVNIASVAGKDGNPNAAPYSAAKAGVIALTKSLGKELAEYDIAVNCITPAAAKTRIFDQISENHIKYMLSKIPRNRFLKVEEAASMVAWLCSAENSFTTGGVFDLSGGRSTY